MFVILFCLFHVSKYQGCLPLSRPVGSIITNGHLIWHRICISFKILELWVLIVIDCSKITGADSYEMSKNYFLLSQQKKSTSISSKKVFSGKKSDQTKRKKRFSIHRQIAYFSKLWVPGTCEPVANKGPAF